MELTEQVVMNCLFADDAYVRKALPFIDREYFQSESNKTVFDLMKNHIEKYNELLIKGFHSPELYFNLGNAYYKLDSLANSIYYYEKGLKYFPNDYSLIQNLEYLNNLTVDDIESVPEDIVSKQFNDFIKHFSLDTWSIITLIIAMLSCILFIF